MPQEYPFLRTVMAVVAGNLATIIILALSIRYIM